MYPTDLTLLVNQYFTEYLYVKPHHAHVCKQTHVNLKWVHEWWEKDVQRIEQEKSSK